MSDAPKQFLQTLAIPVLFVLAFCYMLLSLCIVAFPLNYATASLPFWVVFSFWLGEMHRRQRLGFVHERVREISEERMRFALEEIEKKRNKNKPLP
jgi:hypothetical protein